MKKILFSLSFSLILILASCRDEKQFTKPMQKSKNIAIPIPEDDTIKLSFFDDQEVGDFDDMESFVLDDSQDDKNLSLVENEALFGLQESEQNKQMRVVYFDYDSRKPRADQQETMQMLSDNIKQWTKKGYKVVFKGHSCLWHGTRAYNLALSGQRAQCLADMCQIPKDNLKVFGVGNEEPMVFDNKTKEEQGANRRVEVYPIIA
ncbi:MAG: OmpA family protein [Candidatus Babeliales bacterium]